MEPKATESSVSAPTTALTDFSAANQASTSTKCMPLKSKTPTPRVSPSLASHPGPDTLTVQEPIKLTLPLTTRPAHKKPGKTNKPDKHKKTKTKHPNPDIAQSPKPKKQKHPDPVETSVLLLPELGAVPPEELFQTPKRDSDSGASTLRGMAGTLAPDLVPGRRIVPHPGPDAHLRLLKGILFFCLRSTTSCTSRLRIFHSHHRYLPLGFPRH